MDTWEIKIIGTVICGLIVIILAIKCIGYHLDNVPVKVYKDDQLIYAGVSACVRVQSSGDTTSMRLGRGLWCLLPKAYYTGKNIRVEGSK